jgi:hypothetical protein
MVTDFTDFINDNWENWDYNIHDTIKKVSPTPEIESILMTIKEIETIKKTIKKKNSDSNNVVGITPSER